MTTCRLPVALFDASTIATGTAFAQAPAPAAGSAPGVTA